ncbi:MAG: hypothetical protein PHG96_08105 [Kiritimatiellae bacterium]|nr:hypothetical protein [Kiritimatiellia bacterium]MDD4025170.1 hypothetical protein [Kiritimatiellia bacterium]
MESGRKAEDHEESYARFLTVRETPKRGLRVTFNDAEIQKRRKRYAGFFCLLSSAVKDPMEALRIYRATAPFVYALISLVNRKTWG